MISRVRGLFPDEPVALYLCYGRGIIGQTTTREEKDYTIPVQLMLCATAKKLIADSTAQHDKLTYYPYVNRDTNEKIKLELHQFRTHGQLSLLQPWLITVILPELNSIIPTSDYDKTIARSMREKYAQIEAIANYKGEWSAPIVAQESLTGV